MNAPKSYIDEDGEAIELDEQWFREAGKLDDFPDLARAVRGAGRPPLPEAEKKKRVTLHLDPDVIARLKEGGKGWQTRANAALRDVLGL